MGGGGKRERQRKKQIKRERERERIRNTEILFNKAIAPFEGERERENSELRTLLHKD